MSKTDKVIQLTKVFRISVFLLVVLGALVTILGKGGGGGAITPPATTTSVAIEPATAPAGLPVNFPVQLKAKATLSDGQVTDVTNSATWTSADSNIVEVSATGVVTGKMAGGPAAVTANSGGKDSAPLNIEVKSNLMLSKLEITPFNPAALPVDEKRTHTATATFTDGGTSQTYEVSEKVNWISDNESIVRFDEPSVALAVGNGTAMVRAHEPITATDSNMLPILVTTPVVQGLAISPVPLPGEELLVGFNFPAKALFFYGQTDGLDVTDVSDWTSSSPGILSVGNTNSQVESKGFLIPRSPGKATITARRIGFPDQVDTQEYVVSDTVIESISILVPSVAPVGVGVKVEVTARLQGGQTVDVAEYAVLSVMDPQVATVSNAGANKGFLTGLKAEGTVVRAELPGSNVTPASQNIAFENVPLTTITVTDTDPGLILPVGRTRQFEAKGTFPALSSPQNEFDVTRQVTWASSMPVIATVSNAIAEKGLVTALIQGTTSISAEFGQVLSAGVNRNVSDAVLDSIAIVPTNPTVPLAAGTFKFTAIGTFSDMSMADITESTTWFTGNSAIAKFDPSLNQKFGPGLARLRGSGVTSVTVSGAGAYSGVVGGTQLTVSNANPTAISITGPNTVAVGQKIQLTATATFDDMSMHDVTIAAGWTFDNPAVSVLQGEVTGRAAGMATITARLVTGNVSVSDTHVVNVNP